MGFMDFFVLFMVVVVVVLVVVALYSAVVPTKVTSEQAAENLYGPANPKMLCPHCNSSGEVHTKPIAQKKGVSGGKATAALLTGGVSMLATGLSRKETSTQAHCANCNNSWLF